ncbi:MAG TPA: glycosyltransferase [Acidimicrobiales bacterium]
MERKALLLTGSFGLGHEMLTRACGELLVQSSWQVRTLDSVKLLGPRKGPLAEKAFARLVKVPGVYDGLHFAHLRTGSKLAELMDRASRASLEPALRAELDREPADLIWSVFSTGASAAAKVSFSDPFCRSVVLCTDVAVHRLWVSPGTDLFMVTSRAAAASVRRYSPRAEVAIVHPPVRDEFYAAPSQTAARATLRIPEDAPCVLMIDSGWGFAPFVESAGMLARAGVTVICVAGRNEDLARRLRMLATEAPSIIPFGFTSEVPTLMAASDLVVTLPGATTCSEARVVGRPLLLLDVMPGHGRDNLFHELEQGDANVCCSTPAGITKSVRALLESVSHPMSINPSPPRWQPTVVDALTRIGVDLRVREPVATSPSVNGHHANGTRPVLNRAPT